MHVEEHKITIDLKLGLKPRELDLLINLLSYDSLSAYVKGITPNSYEGGVTTEEMIKFIALFKANLKLAKSNVIKSMERASQVWKE